MKTTITEALAELKLIEKKIAKKMDVLNSNLTRVTHLPDPFAANGGSMEYNKSELQSIAALYVRHTKIRTSIAQANLENTITIGEESGTIASWLVWKREVAPKAIPFLNNLAKNAKSAIDRASVSPQAYKDENGESQIVKVVSNFDYPGLLKVVENHQEKLDALDGQLSLKNATIVIEI